MCCHHPKGCVAIILKDDTLYRSCSTIHSSSAYVKPVLQFICYFRFNLLKNIHVAKAASDCRYETVFFAVSYFAETSVHAMISAPVPRISSHSTSPAWTGAFTEIRFITSMQESCRSRGTSVFDFAGTRRIVPP